MRSSVSILLENSVLSYALATKLLNGFVMLISSVAILKAVPKNISVIPLTAPEKAETCQY